MACSRLFIPSTRVNASGEVTTNVDGYGGAGSLVQTPTPTPMPTPTPTPTPPSGTPHAEPGGFLRSASVVAR